MDLRIVAERNSRPFHISILPILPRVLQVAATLRLKDIDSSYNPDGFCMAWEVLPINEIKIKKLEAEKSK